MEAYQPGHLTGRRIGRLERLMYRHERWMYGGPRPNRVAAFLNAIWARAGAAGWVGHGLVTLEVRGRRSGRRIEVPLIVADRDGERWLVAMLGERADWVANVRAAGGRAVLRHGRVESVLLDEVNPAERGPIVRRHLEVAPAARSFLPVSRTASDADLDAVASAIPVFRIRNRPEAVARTDLPRPEAVARADLPRPDAAPPDTSAPETAPADTSAPETAPAAGGEAGLAVRPRRRRRRLLVASAGVLALIAVIGLVIVGTRSGPPPLSLPAIAAEPPAGPLDGRWAATSGSIAGFRVDQVFLGMHAAVVGRTTVVSGTVDVADGQVTGGSFTVDLTSLTVNGKPQPQIAISLGTATQPIATIQLDAPVTVPGGLAEGGVVAMTASGSLTLRGARHEVSISMVARRNGSTVEVVGSMPVAFADWGIAGPTGYGDLGSLADHGVAEFLLVLEHANG